MEKKCIWVERIEGEIHLTLEGVKESEILHFGYTIDDVAERITKLLRLSERPELNVSIDLKAGVIRHDATEVPLLAKEIMILRYFYKHPGEIISRKQLFEEIWHNEFSVNTRTLDVHISRLRQKLGDVEDAQSCIQTVRGIGYKFIAP